jgi:signal transduction histidine kinase
MRLVPASLTGRIIVRLIVFQILAGVATAIASTLFLSSPDETYFIAQAHVGDLTLEALSLGTDGRPFITDTPAMRRFRAERPQVRIVVVDREGREVEGSDPDLLAALRAYDLPHFYRAPEYGSGRAAIFTIPDSYGGPLAGAVVVAASGEEEPYGSGTLFVARNELRAEDLPAFVGHVVDEHLPTLGPVLVVVVLVVPLLVRQALRPLLAATREAAAIDLHARDLRLPEGKGVPSELQPLARGINAALARLDESFRRQQRFAAQAAHEMRTPLAIIAARIDGMADRQEAEALRRNVERMRSLVDRLLFIARLERRDVPLDESLDLVALARDVVADCAPLAIAEDRKLALLPDVARLPLRGNARALESALVNLIENAVRAEPAGGTIEVMVRGPGEILVVDHGAGIAPADRERVFEPFWRRHDRNTGAGLGLTIVKEAATAHGGSIAVEETRGGGATFRLRLGQSATGDVDDVRPAA